MRPSVTQTKEKECIFCQHLNALIAAANRCQLIDDGEIDAHLLTLLNVEIIPVNNAISEAI